MWQVVAGGVGLALVFLALAALKYKGWMDAEVKEYEKITEDLRDVLRKRNLYVNALEYKVLEKAGPAELARVLNRVFDEDGDDDTALPGDPPSD